jgi:uncharacterized protein (DUF58 family)
VVSLTGWFVLLAALVAFIGAAMLGWIELVFLGATLLAALLVSVPFAFGRMHYRVQVALQPTRVVAGERAFGRLSVTNVGQASSIPSRMELPVGAGIAEFIVPALPAAGEHEELFAVPTSRRAVIVAGPAISVRGDQLGLLRRIVRWSDPVELFVHPVTARLKPSAAGLVRDLEGEITKTITDNDISFHALRAYQPGDPLRNVHWRTSARTGTLMVRQFEETRRSQLALLQCTERAHYASDDEFELAISVMASIGCQVIREKTNLDVLWERAALRNRSAIALLDDSCRIEPVEGDFPSLRDFMRSATRSLPVPSLVMLVVGSQAPTNEIRSVTTLYGNDTVMIAVRVALDEQAGLSKIGRTVVATVGRLGDLPAILERAGR